MKLRRSIANAETIGKHTSPRAEGFHVIAFALFPSLFPVCIDAQSY